MVAPDLGGGRTLEAQNGLCRGRLMPTLNQHLAGRSAQKRNNKEDVMAESIRVLPALMAAAGSFALPALPLHRPRTKNWARCTSRRPARRPPPPRSTGGCCISIPSGIAPRNVTSTRRLKADPGCGIAYWGIALSLLWNPHTAPPVKNLADGAAMLAKGKEVGARTERERDYITALSAMYTDFDKVDHHTRVLNYMKAMEQLAAKYPNDDEAQIDSTRSRSMSVLRQRIRPMPINSRARRYWRRSGCASRIIRASRIT